jgi:hypothetical protein
MLTAALASIALALVAACGDVTSPVTAALATDGSVTALSKSGDNNAHAHAIHVRITNMVFNATVVDEYSFNAVRHGDDVNGNFQFYQTRIVEGVQQAVVIASGPIVCLKVTENRARVGGRVESTTFPEGIPVGSEITWSATDNGKSAYADDSASEPLGNNARTYCQLGQPYPEHVVERGKIQIMD